MTYYFYFQKDLPEIKKEIEEFLEQDEMECSPLKSDDIIAHVGL